MTNNPAREAIAVVDNSAGRSTYHILVGVGVTVGAVALSALIARMHAPSEEAREVYSDYEELEPPASKPQPRFFASVWPPLFTALTLSGLRIWNAPPSAARTQALTLWGTAQALNAVWMALGPRRLGGQLAAAVASIGTSLAYVWRARQVDTHAANMVTPFVGWIGFANVLTEELWRKSPTPATLH